MNILVVGLGLIGGSIAKALSPKHRVCGMDKSRTVLDAAFADGAISAAAGEPAGFDVIYLCLYPEDVVEFTKRYGASFGENTVVSDVCGIKGTVCPPMEALAEKFGFAYVGGHPMAGKEETGYRASEAGLFRGASYIIATGCQDRGAAVIAELAGEMGFGTVIYTSPLEHDRMIAFTSQTPHVLACAYVMSPQCPGHKGFSAGSYRDVSRVAKINEALWTGLFLSNRERLTEELDILTENIGRLRGAIAAGDAQTLEALLRQAREMKEGADSNGD